MNRVIRLHQYDPNEWCATVPMFGGCMAYRFRADSEEGALWMLQEALKEETINISQAAIVMYDAGECEMGMTFLCRIGGKDYFTQWDPSDFSYDLFLKITGGFERISYAGSKRSCCDLARLHHDRLTQA